MHIGIIRERKSPPDTRVALTPQQCQRILEAHPTWEVTVEHSPNRCYSNQEYLDAGISMSEELRDCDVLFGVKEVPIDHLIPNKKYFFFSHTIKKQAHNKKLLKALIAKNIQLIDYECLCDTNGKRIIGFGKYAGIVGAHNGLLGYGKKTRSFSLPRACESRDLEALKKNYQNIKWPNFRTIITGGGRVGKGAMEIMRETGIQEISPADFLREKEYDFPVWCNLRSRDIYKHRESKLFDKRFYEQPENFICEFQAFYSRCDLFINGVYWDPDAPAYFSKEEMRSSDFRISSIADITCDIAPEASIPSTLYASTIAKPFFDYNPKTEKAEAPFQPSNVLIMSIDNLPNELPRDASFFFGTVLLEKVLPELSKPDSHLIENASICKAKDLTRKYDYLRSYAS